MRQRLDMGDQMLNLLVAVGTLMIAVPSTHQTLALSSVGLDRHHHHHHRHQHLRLQCLCRAMTHMRVRTVLVVPRLRVILIGSRGLPVPHRYLLRVVSGPMTMLRVPSRHRMIAPEGTMAVHRPKGMRQVADTVRQVCYR